MSRRSVISLLAILMLVVAAAPAGAADKGPAINAGMDLYNRYVWRGIDIAGTPSVQPSLSVSWLGFELGAWGAYTISGDGQANDEIDFWLSYSRAFESGASFSLIATDYYYPNAGPGLFNFNDYDAVTDGGEPDPGAHTLELGLSLTAPGSFPLTLSAYVNVYNEAGNNTYFELDYPLTVGDVDLGIFCGMAGGSSENPGYYGTEKFNAINIGVSASRKIDVSESFSLPVEVSFIVNPKAEISYLVAGVSF